MSAGSLSEQNGWAHEQGQRAQASQPEAAPRFLIVDDHRFVCEALVQMIRQHWPFAMVRQADSLAGAQALLAEAPFDVAVLDFCMPGEAGGAAIETIRARYPDVKLVIFSGAIPPRDALKALSLGVAAYVPKSIAAHSMVQVLTLVLEGETYVPRGLIEAMAGGLCEEECTPAAQTLSARDMTLLNALVKGHPNKVIAHAMGVSESTVKLYLHKLFQTLGVHNRTEAVAKLASFRQS
jgi:DNA-binding NarL/FixJ family response regulator